MRLVKTRKHSPLYPPIHESPPPTTNEICYPPSPPRPPAFCRCYVIVTRYCIPLLFQYAPCRRLKSARSTGWEPFFRYIYNFYNAKSFHHPVGYYAEVLIRPRAPRSISQVRHRSLVFVLTVASLVASSINSGLPIEWVPLLSLHSISGSSFLLAYLSLSLSSQFAPPPFSSHQTPYSFAIVDVHRVFLISLSTFSTALHFERSQALCWSPSRKKLKMTIWLSVLLVVFPCGCSVYTVSYSDGRFSSFDSASPNRLHPWGQPACCQGSQDE